nr:RecName: Full=Phospholipase A2 BF-CT1; Short=PLA2; AltName: Full=Phosphatidylcholine 2-acylhydrolase [Bungarus fasciatus]
NLYQFKNMIEEAATGT